MESTEQAHTCNCWIVDLLCYRIDYPSEVLTRHLLTTMSLNYSKRGFCLLEGDRIHFIPEFVGPFLEMALVPEPNLRKAVMPIFFEMMLQEWENTNSFTKVSLPSLFISAWLCTQRGRHQNRSLINEFTKYLLGRF